MGEDNMTVDMTKRPRSKGITREELDEMFRLHDEEMAKRMENMCDSCSHNDCECPAKIEHMGKVTEAKMDQLDENDEALRQNINRLANMMTDGFNDLERKNQANIADTNSRLEEEHRLRELSEQELKKVKEEYERLNMELREANVQVSSYKRIVNRNSADVMKLGAITGAVLGVGLVVVALAIAGVF